MTHRKQRLTPLLTTGASVALAGWLLHIAGVWPGAASLSQFLLFMFCVFGINRVVSAAVDLVTIALAPIETVKDRY